MEEASHYVKRVVLPSGKTIEVVLFKEGAPAAGEAASPSEVQPHQDLQVCVECSSELVFPTAWEQEGDDAWRVTLRCPSCETWREGVFSQETVEHFDAELDAGSEALTADLRRLTRANMAEEIDRFRAALDADALLPEDF
jgi:hypothetical protein